MEDYISRERLLRDPYIREGRYSCSDLIRMAINEQPKADVVPRSEVERLEAEKDNLIKNYAECQKEFAMEIIAEFKSMVINYVKDRDLLLIAFKNAVAYAEAEVKKKYIGG